MHKRKIITRKILPPIVFFILLIMYINLFPPEGPVNLTGFFLLSFLLGFFTAKMFFNPLRSLIWSSGILSALFLRQQGVGNILNLILIAAIILTLELYFRKS